MSNQYFQFKQFRIEQDNCAMKVTTDACIQGAWTPIMPVVKRVLDIGTGTGLLALMIAQRSSGAIIDAIEFDKDAATQAVQNAASSPWHERINVMTGDVRDFTANEKYDLIISNPPFFNNSLQSDNVNKNIARHTASLSYEELVQAIERNLIEYGYISILLPYNEYLLWKTIAAGAGYSEFCRLNVKHTDTATVKRVVGLFSKNSNAVLQEETLIIREDETNYTAAFTALLSPFYLGL